MQESNGKTIEGEVINMVKGVHRNIIEINETGDDCFERAILFVRADSRSEERDVLQRKAQRYLAGLRLRAGMLPKVRWFIVALRYCAALTLGAVIATMVF